MIDQQEWLQGFLAVLQLCLTHEYGFSGLFINTGGGFDDKSNIDTLAPLVDQADPLADGDADERPVGRRALRRSPAASARTAGRADGRTAGGERGSSSATSRSPSAGSGVL